MHHFVLLKSHNKLKTWPFSSDLEYFVREKELFQELNKVDTEFIERFIYVKEQVNQSWYKVYVDGDKMMETFKECPAQLYRNMNANHKTMLDEYLKEENSLVSKLGSVVGFMNILSNKTKDERRLFHEELQKGTDINDEFVEGRVSLAEICEYSLCNEVVESCEYCETLSRFLYSFDEYGSTYLRTVGLTKFFATIDLIEYILNGDIIISEPQDLLADIKNYILFSAPHENLSKLTEDELLLKRLVNYGDNIEKFWRVISELGHYVYRKKEIKITYYPQSQGIPKKYFPLNGDEEKPYVAIKLHLQEKSG